MLAQRISWLHISDLHFQKDTWDSDIILKELVKDVESEMAKHRLTFDFLFVTGDIAFSGKKKEYQNAREFLKKLWKVTGLGPGSTYIVPGNHDVSRGVSPQTAHGMRNDLTDAARVDAYLAFAELNFILRRERNFQEFVNENCLRTVNRFGCFAVDNVRTKELSIMGLNSAWLSQDEQDERKLLIGDKQLREALIAAGNSRWKIVLVHHPLSWLRDFDSQNAWQLLIEQNCVLLLRGHLHETGFVELATPDGRLVRLAAGAAFETRRSRNAYNFAQLNLATGELRVFLRRFSGSFFGADTQTCREARNTGTLDWNIAVPRRGTVPRRAKPDRAATSLRLPAPIHGPGPRVVVLYTTDDWTVLTRTYLLRSLELPAREEKVDFWYDQRMNKARWDQDASAYLAQAQIVVCVVSPSFIRSKGMEELEARMKTDGKDQVTVIPLMLSPCAWGSRNWQKGVKTLPADQRYLRDIRTGKKKVFDDVAGHLRDCIREMKKVGAGADYSDASALYFLRRKPDALHSFSQKKILRADSIQKADHYVPDKRLQARICRRGRSELKRNAGKPLSKSQLEALDKDLLARRRRKPDAESIRWVLRAAGLHPQGAY